MGIPEIASPDVLVVDDQPDIREVLRLAFKREGLTVELEENSMRALVRATELAPRCVVLDVMMPDLDGFGFLEALRRSPELQAVPVVFLSGKRRERDFVKGLELGAVEYATKPFDPLGLARRVREVIDMTPKDREQCRRARLQQAQLLQQVEDAFARRR